MTTNPNKLTKIYNSLNYKYYNQAIIDNNLIDITLFNSLLIDNLLLIDGTKTEVQELKENLQNKFRNRKVTKRNKLALKDALSCIYEY